MLKWQLEPSLQVFRQRFVNLTREACNYLGSHYHDITEQLLRSVDLLLALFECPRVYADVEMVRGTGKGLNVFPMCVYVCVCFLGVCVCFLHVYVCVCVCERERERERKREMEERCERVIKYIFVLVNVLYVVVSWEMV